MRDLDYDNLTDEDIAWMKSRNMTIPGEDEETATPQSITPTAVNDGATYPPDDADRLTEGYEEANVAALKAELGKRGLPVSGNKDELVERLYEDDEAE